jgi:hypothetical protein
VTARSSPQQRPDAVLQGIGQAFSLVDLLGDFHDFAIAYEEFLPHQQPLISAVTRPVP